MRDETIGFPGARGETLTGRLAVPADGRVLGAALFAHAFAPSPDPSAARHIARALTQSGLAVVRVGVTAAADAHEGDGDPSGTSFSETLDDLLAAAAWMGEAIRAPALLVGHSLGGAAVLAAATRVPSCRAVATIGAPFRRPDGGDSNLAALGRPLAIFHSPVDEVVSIENAAMIYTSAPHPKSFISLDGADHMLRDERDAVFAGDMLATWAARYLEPRPERAQTERELEEDTQISARTGRGGFLTEILARGHALLADEPASVGGTDRGPTPYDLLAAALGACTTMTLRMYADRKGWPLEEASVLLRHRKLHARDDEAVCEGREARLDALERDVALEGPLDPEQRARLMEIAERCPVHRTLSRGVVIHTREAPARPSDG